MTAHVESVARYIAEKSGWRVSNLKLQKLLYLTQMIYMGRTGGERMFDCDFEAWDYGPVCPEIYRKLRPFGSSNVADVFLNAKRFREGDSRREIMDEICDHFLAFSAGDLVDITHSPIGAWNEHYVPSARGISIPDEAILKEYSDRNSIERSGENSAAAG